MIVAALKNLPPSGDFPYRDSFMEDSSGLMKSITPLDVVSLSQDFPLIKEMRV